jgi:hypothetical protein
MCKLVLKQLNGSHRGNLGELIEITYRSADPCPGFGKKKFLGEASNSGNEIEGSPWALCNQLAHCAGVHLFIISVKEMHIGLGINNES